MADITLNCLAGKTKWCRGETLFEMLLNYVVLLKFAENNLGDQFTCTHKISHQYSERNIAEVSISQTRVRALHIDTK